MASTSASTATRRCSAGGVADGILQNAPTSGQHALVVVHGGTLMRANAAITAEAERPLGEREAARLTFAPQGQGRWPALQTLIPPGLAPQVAQWDPVALGYEPSGQRCPRGAASR